MIAGKNQQQLQYLLRAIRKESKVSQKDLAQELGKPQSFVSKYESGERRLDILELRQICLALNTNLKTFVTRLEDELNKNAS